MTTPFALIQSPFKKWSPLPSHHFWSRMLRNQSAGVVAIGTLKPFFSTSLIVGRKKRRTLICAVNEDAEGAFKKTVEVDRLIDMLRNANASELQKLVAENILAFNEGFWLCLAARTDTCISEDDKARILIWLFLLVLMFPRVILSFVLYVCVQFALSWFVCLQKDYEDLAASVMSIVDRLVRQTTEKIDSATDVLKNILKPVFKEEEEILWPPRDPGALKLMEKEIIHREKEGQLDEGFLSEVNAQLRQAKEDKDKPGFEAMLQKVLQLYASRVLSKRSYARKGEEILMVEQFLEAIIKAPEEEWNELLIDGMSLGRGAIPPEEFYAVIKKRIERTLIRTESGSYQQRVLTEYLKGIRSRTEETVKVLQGKTQR